MTMSYSSIVPSPMPTPVAGTIRRINGFPTKGLLVGFAVGLAGVIVGSLLYFCIRRKCCFRKWNRQYRASKDLLMKTVELRRFRLDELEKATMSFSEECLVGSGAFGNVYKGVFDEGTLAIKRAQAVSYQSVQEFRNEVELLSRVKHRNLVGLVGYCEEGGQKILIYEYVPNGSLLEYIVGRRRKTLTWRQRVNIAIGAAKGIAHLHEGVQPSIIHRDIKPSNILIGDGFEAKVSDFGLVKSGPVGDESHVSSQIKGTPGYLDPAYCSSSHLTPFSDVYSFGVILLQLVAARPAIDTSKPQSQYHIIDWARPSLERGIVEEILDANLLLEACNNEMMLKMGEIGLRCVVKRPKDRPTMSQVARELEDALRSATTSMYKHPSRISPRNSIERDDSQSFVSIDGMGFQKFHVDMDDLTLHSVSMKCLDVNSIGFDFEKHNLEGITEETGRSYENSPVNYFHKNRT